MRIALPAACALLAAALAGCTPPQNGGEETDLSHIEILRHEDLVVDPDAVPPLPPRRNEYDVKLFSPDDAPKAPSLEVRPVMALSAPQQKVHLARPNEVTMVVFAGMDMSASAYALQKVNRLVEKYGREVYPVNAVGIIMPTRGHERAPNWHRSRDIQYPFYYDDVKMTALKRMSRAADIDTPENFPAVFIVGRRGGIRYYRHGFKATVYPEDTTKKNPRLIIEENVPEEYTLENGLRIVLRKN
jgi:hypothetical protein